MFYNGIDKIVCFFFNYWEYECSLIKDNNAFSLGLIRGDFLKVLHCVK